MAVTTAAPVASHHEKRPEFRPISSNLPVRPTTIGRLDMTASRPAGVERPTLPPSASASAGRAVDTDAAPLPTPALVQEAVDTALDSLDVLEAQARDTARRFRRAALDEAQVRLADLVNSTRTLIALAGMAAEASGTTLESLSEAHGLGVERQTQSALGAMIARQLDRDWAGLARALETPFVEALDGWRRIFLALDGSTGPMGSAA